MKHKLERGKKKMNNNGSRLLDKENKGFTLIELLAVIVILAIIALIAVPVVMNIINKANKSAFKDSAYGLIKAGELFYTDQLLENAGLNEDKTFTFPNDTDGLEIKGSKPTGGYVTVNKKGQVSMAVTNGKYCVTKDFEDDDVKITEDLENCEVTDNTRDVLDNAWPIEWNTLDVVNNTSTKDDEFVRVSELVLTAAELQYAKGSFLYEGRTFAFSYVESQSMGNVNGAIYKVDENDMQFVLISVSSAGEYAGIVFSEPGLYAMNLGHENMIGIDANVFVENGENPFPIEWNMMAVAGNKSVNNIQPFPQSTFVKVSSKIPSINVMSFTTAIAQNDSNSMNYTCLNIVDNGGYYMIIYSAENLTFEIENIVCLIVLEAGEYGGVVFEEAGFYVHDIYAEHGYNYNITINVGA